MVGKNKRVFSVIIEFYYLVKKADINHKPNFCEVDTAVEGKLQGSVNRFKERLIYSGRSKTEEVMMEPRSEGSVRVNWMK